MNILCYTIFFCFLVLLNSCGSIRDAYYKKKYGIYQPKIEDATSVRAYLKNVIHDTTFAFCLSDTMFIEHSKQKYKTHLKGQKYPQIRCFDNQGRIVMQWATCEGFLHDLDLFGSYPPKNPNNLDTQVTWTKTTNELSELSGSKVDASHWNISNYDLIFVVYFTQYFRYNGDAALKEISKYIVKYPHKKILFLKVDADAMNFWQAELNMNLKFKS